MINADGSDALLRGAARQTWDAIVVGAGPAGAIAARQIALSGLETLLVDAKRFPREKVCGGYLNSRALEVLRQIGLESTAGAGAESAANELELICGRQRVRFPLPPGRVICRATFDAALVESARIAGAKILLGAHAVVGPTDCDESRCVTVAGNGTRQTLNARVVVCADGLSRSSVRHLPEFSVSTAADSRIGIGAVVVGDVEACQMGRITMVVSRHGYVGISRIGARQLNVAAAVDPQLLSHAAPGEIVASILEAAGVRVSIGIESAVWRGTPPLTSQPASVAAKRLFLIGDAGGYVEPFTGEGMAAALETSVAVAPFAMRATEAWVPSLAVCWQALHRQIVRDRQLTCRQLAWILRRPWAAFAAMSICRIIPGVAGRLIAKTSIPSTVCLPAGMSTP